MSRSELDAAVARLDDYVRRRDVAADDDAAGDENAAGDDDAALAGYEDDLFTRALAGAAPELRFRQDLASIVRALGARGTLDLWLTARDAERVRASGARAAYYDLVDLANPAPFELPPDAELLIARVPLPLEGVRALEVEVLTADGQVLKRMPDVAFDPADGAVFACCEVALARIAGDAGRTTRFWATDARGRRLLAEIPALG